MRLKNLLFEICKAVIAVAVLVCVGCSRHESSNADSQPAETTYTPDFYEEWRATGKLDLASMTVTKTVSTERSAWYKVGDRIAVYSFDIYLRAYMNMEKLRPSDIIVEEESKRIIINLPPIQSEITGRSSDMRLEYEDIGIFRSRPDSKERAALKEKANADFIREFKGNPTYKAQLETAATKKARNYFQSLGEAAGYKVEFSNSLPLQNIKD